MQVFSAPTCLDVLDTASYQPVSMHVHGITLPGKCQETRTKGVAAHSQEGYSPLMAAAHEGHTAIVSFLIAQGGTLAA
eukprot:364198-Chlamydomonas_euryale.AAC.11